MNIAEKQAAECATRREYEKQRANEIAQAAIATGYRAFIAEQGNYGFYTDAEGSRVVSFQVNGYFEESVSGNYKTSAPKSCGQGWRITDSVDLDRLDDYFKAFPPQWAVGAAQWSHKTMAEHLTLYNESSKYQGVQP